MTEKKDEKAKRLAEALRENLRRRKAQSRAAATPSEKDGARETDRED